MNKMIWALLAVGVLAGCANTYNLDGKNYKGEKRFQAAVEKTNSGTLAQVSKLPAPLTEKKLVAILPGETALFAENIKRVTAANRNTPPQGKSVVLIENLSKSNYKLTRAMFEGVEKRGIYKEVEIRDASSMNVSAEPSPDYDVLFYTEPAANSGQYFYSSSKHGKQVFAYDRSGIGPAEKINAFIEAVQSMAIRN